MKNSTQIHLTCANLHILLDLGLSTQSGGVTVLGHDLGAWSRSGKRVVLTEAEVATMRDAAEAAYLTEADSSERGKLTGLLKRLGASS